MKSAATILIFLTLALSAPASAFQAAGPDAAVSDLAHRWAVITYQTHDEALARDAMTALSADAEKIVAAYPKAAAPLIWDGIIKYSVANYVRGLQGFGLVKQAKGLFEKALDIEPDNSAALSNLGFLYYQVPGFPIGFGSDKMARHYLEKALALTPDDIDVNYFYGDFLVEKGEYTKARDILTHALDLPPKAGQPVADQGRRNDIRELLTRIGKKLGRNT